MGVGSIGIFYIMKSLVFIFLITLCICYVDGYKSIIRYDPQSNQTSHCYTTFGDIGEMEDGEEKRLPHKCAMADCNTSRDIIIRGCGVARVAPPCRIIAGDLTKPYPDCCFEIICP